MSTISDLASLMSEVCSRYACIGVQSFETILNDGPTASGLVVCVRGETLPDEAISIAGDPAESQRILDELDAALQKIVLKEYQETLYQLEELRKAIKE